jgi:hypothetical protein
MTASFQTISAGLGLVLVAWVGVFSAGIPTLVCPLPTVTFLPALFLASPPSYLSLKLAALVPALLFFAWNPGLFCGTLQAPKRSWVLLAILTALSAFYFRFSWRYGNEYQGHKYTEIICAINVGWIVILWAVLWRASRLRSFGSNLLFHATLFAWLAWYAFPFLGELT